MLHDQLHMTKVYTKMVPKNNAPGYIVKEFLTKNLTKVLHLPPFYID